MEDKKAIRSTAISGVRWTGIKTIVISVGSFLLLAILIRYLEPEDFGLFALATILFKLSIYFSDLGLSEAIMNKKDPSKRELDSLYWINIAAGIILFGFVLLIRKWFATFYGEEELIGILFWTGLNLLMVTFGQQFRVLLQKAFRFDIIARVELIGFFAYFIVGVVLAVKGFGVWALVYAEVVKIILISISYLIGGFHLHRPSLKWDWTSSKPFVKFGLFQVGRSFTEYLYNAADNIIIGKVFPTATLGIYDVIKKVAIKPGAVASPILGEVAFPLMAERQEDLSLVTGIYTKTLKYLNSASYPICVFLFLFAEPLLNLVFGLEWGHHSSLLRVLTVYFMLRQVEIPTGNLLLAVGKVDWGFWWNLMVVVVTVIAIFAGISNDVLGVAIALGVLQFLLVILIFIVLLKPILSIKFTSYANTFVSPLILSIVAGGIAWFSSQYFINDILKLAVAGVLFFTAYAVLSRRFNDEFMSDLLELIRRKSIKESEV